MSTFRARVLRILATGLPALLCWAGTVAHAIARDEEAPLRPEMAMEAPQTTVNSYESQIEELSGSGEDGSETAIRLQIKLGWALIALADEEGGSALDRALVAFDKALNAWTPDNSLTALGMAQTGLGRAYAELALLRDPEENIKAALTACEEAVIAFIRVDDGYGYALAQSVLALTEHARAVSQGDADYAGDALKASNEALQIFSARNFPLEFARTQYQVGLIYTYLAGRDADRTQAEQAREAFRASREIYARLNLTAALERVEEGMSELAARQPDLTWTETEIALLDDEHTHDHDEANTTGLARQPVSEGSVEQRRPVARPVVPTPEDLAYEELQRGYAALKQDPASGDTLDRYKQAVSHFENALKTYDRQATPVRWAEAQNGLGAALWGLRSGAIGISRVDASIEAFQKALDVYTREDNAEQFAVTQSHLGAAWHFKARQSDAAQGVKPALEAYEAALKVWSAEGRPVEYARLCNSVADLYLLLAEKRDPERYVQLALQMLEAAIQAQNREANPRSYAESKAGMGRAYYRLSKITENPADLRRAIEANNETIDIYQAENMIEAYSALQGHQGTVYLALSYHEARKENVTQAVNAYAEALKTMPASASARTRSTTRINLGTAYYQLAQMSQTEMNGKLAIKSFEEAQEELGGDESNPLFEAASARTELVNKLLRDTRYVFGKDGT